MGKQCYHVVHLRSPEPVSLRPSQKEDVCDRCREAGYTLADTAPEGIATADSSASTLAESDDEWFTECGKEVANFQGPILWCQECMDLFCRGEFPRVCEPWDSDTTPPEQRYDELLRAARVLLDAGITDEGKIIPTLAFAARLWEVTYLRDIRDQLVEASEEPERWIKLRDKFVNSFHPFEPMEVTNEVLIIREIPTEVLGLVNDVGVTEEISIDVFRRSARPRQDVAGLYRDYLKSYGIPYNRGDRGDVSYKVYHNFIRLMVRPENRTIDPIGKIMVWPKVEMQQQAFPPPQIVESLYKAVRGSMSTKAPGGFAYILGGKERGPGVAADTLILACVAWYVGKRGQVVQQGALKPKVARVLNEHLLRPCALDTLSEVSWDSSQLVWRNTKKWSQAILRIDHALRDSFGSLGQGTSDKFF